VEKISGSTQADLEGAAASTETWLYASHDYAGSRFVNLDQITSANAKDLRPVCLYRSEQSASVQTSPLVYRGVMYLTFGRATVALDAKSCRERWSYTWQPKAQEISPTKSWRSHRRWPARARNRRRAAPPNVRLGSRRNPFLLEEQVASDQSYTSNGHAIREDND
jgi:glucose dehydrogenase